jgi:hypothetical protein
VNANQALVVTQEQLEQIRQLRVPSGVTGKEERRELPTRRSLVQGTTNKAPWNSYGVCAGIWFD